MCKYLDLLSFFWRDGGGVEEAIFLPEGKITNFFCCYFYFCSPNLQLVTLAIYMHCSSKQACLREGKLPSTRLILCENNSSGGSQKRCFHSVSQV